MGVGITWTAGLSSDRPGVEKGPRSGPVEHWDLQAPSHSLRTCLGSRLALPQPRDGAGVEAVLSTRSLTTRPPGRQLCPGGATASDAACPLEWVFLIPSVKELDLPAHQSPGLMQCVYT